MANAILQLSGVELQQNIEQELEENPALEQEDEEPCSGCELAPFLCKDCQYGKQREQDASPNDDEKTLDFDPLNEPELTFDFQSDPEDDIDPMGFLKSDIDLKEHLRIQLGYLASGKISDIADYLINYIDESGYLRVDLLEVTMEMDATDEEILEAVAVIQTLDPPGVGAMDLKQCMRIQLRYLAEDGCGNPIAEKIVNQYWEEMRCRKHLRIARRLKVDPIEVEEAVHFIHHALNPYPAAGFRIPWETKAADNKSTVRPDVIIHRTPIGFEIEVVTNKHVSLTINPYYRQMFHEMRNGKAKSYTAEDKKHVTEYVERADLFIRNIYQRRRTLKLITKHIVEQEIGFFETGSNLFLRPLTRVRVATSLGLHESTISRATANKYVMLPNGEVLSFDFFFAISHSLADTVAQMIANEDPGHPLSDQELAELLTQQGFPVARRTVVKYREARKLLSSRQRKR